MKLEKIGIIGYGVTTKPIVNLLKKQNIHCLVYDDKQEDQQNFLDSKSFLRDFRECDCVITSPGVPPSHPVIQAVQNSSIPLFSEYDFFHQIFCGKFENFIAPPKPLEIWISGTNGKTTTTQMLEFLLAHWGGVSGGNIGTPLASLYECLDSQKQALWILETSSFTLHYTHLSSPRLYILLPVFEDHIDWHSGFEGYVEDKLSVLARLGVDDRAIIPATLREHPLCMDTKAQIFFYNHASDLNEEFDLDLKTSVFQEPFLLDAALALSAQKVLLQQAQTQKLNAFKIGAHRLEEFLDSKGRLWVDDSKGTNIDASIAAVSRYENYAGMHLILGGDSKGANLYPLFEKISDLGDKVIIYGIGSNAKDLESMAKEFHLKYHQCFHLDVAVEQIKQVLGIHEVALLSPAAASLDQFSSYKERGEKFRTLALS